MGAKFEQIEATTHCESAHARNHFCAFPSRAFCSRFRFTSFRFRQMHTQQLNTPKKKDKLKKQMRNERKVGGKM